MAETSGEEGLKWLEKQTKKDISKEVLEKIAKNADDYTKYSDELMDIIGLYEGRTDDIIEYVNKNGDDGVEEICERFKSSNKIISTIEDLSQEQINAIIKYTGDNYVNINNSLRGLETATVENQKIIEILKYILGNSSLQQDMTLYRGTSTEALGNLKNLEPEDLIGKTFIESGFMSTSKNVDVANGIFSGNIQMTIEASIGAHALDISSISQYSNEVEILFNAGQEMLITSAEMKNDILYITVLIE